MIFNPIQPHMLPLILLLIGGTFWLERTTTSLVVQAFSPIIHPRTTGGSTCSNSHADALSRHNIFSSTALRSTPGRRRRRPVQPDGNFYNDDDDDYEPREAPPFASSRPRSSSRKVDYYDEEKEDDDYMYRDNDDDDDAYDPYATGSQKKTKKKRDYYDDDGYYYDDENDEEDYDDNPSSNNSVMAPPPRIEWEEVQVPNLRTSRDDDSSSYSTAYVLLPPSPPSMHPKPSAVLHFVGGTMFGSAPKTFYRPLLEDIVTHTQCAIVVTPLPIITPLNVRQTLGPLHHVQMAKKLQHQFQYAFRQVLEDEYGGAEAMENVPIAGLGHSLGSRLLVVLATLMKDNHNNNEDDDDNDAFDDRGRQRRRRPTNIDYQYKSMILISFTNFGASAGIPGITSLLKQRRQIEERNQNRRQRTRRREKPKEEPVPRSRRRNNRDWYDDDDDDDDDDIDLLEDFSELWSSFRGIFQDQTDRVKTKLTPIAEDLEFYPTPRQLWKALEGDEERKSKYKVPQTLLIQFDRDDVDQSAKLATVLVSNNNVKTPTTTTTSSVNGNSTSTTREPVPTMTTKTDLKFARLRGTHLTPVTTTSSQIDNDALFSDDAGIMLREWSKKSTKAAWNAIQGRIVGGGKTEGGNLSQDEALRDLRQTITRYIADIVTK